ncbi:uncharacterized protein syt18b [Engraulis encrasicolus]|uniref:uncharacterized protein syt18b n=1 Tax=Engraulis encrasicolus TaxID=184585 RepID=UPI002FD6F181
MPASEEEEDDGLPLWQSVLLFCCKGMIEGIIVILFFWLLIQVLFTKELEIHLQVLLGAGLTVFCLSLLLGCFLCLWRMRSLPPESKQDPPIRPTDRVTPAAAAAAVAAPGAVTAPAPAHTSSASGPHMRVLCEQPEEEEEEEEEETDYPSAFASSTASADNFCVLPMETLRRPSTPVLLVEGEGEGKGDGQPPEPPSSLPYVRRLSSPTLLSVPPLERPRASLPTLPRLGLLWRTRLALERRCTITGGLFRDGERSRLIDPSSAATSPVSGPAAASRTRGGGRRGALSRFRTESFLPCYGSSSSSTFNHAPSSVGHASTLPSLRAPSLHFTLCFSPAHHTLTISLISLSGASHRLGTGGALLVLARLPPVQPGPAEVLVTRHRGGLSPKLHGPGLVLCPVSSLEELRGCTLQLAVFSQDLSGHQGARSPLGQVELSCGEMAWEPEVALACRRRLRVPGGGRGGGGARAHRGGTSHDAAELVGQAPPIVQLSAPPPPQLFILLQYQTLAHRIKVMVLKAENLAGTGMQEHHVVINLRLDGLVISSRSTGDVAGQDSAWNSPFLFDLPPGDVTHLPLRLEFLLIKGHIYSTSNVVGRTVIGQEAEENGQAHWNDMCSRSQVEVARWHIVQSEAL